MSPGIRLQWTLSRPALPESSEQQLLYALVEAQAEGIPASAPRLPLSLGVVLDRSSSMRGERLIQVKEALNRIVDQLAPDDQFTLVTFNDRAEVAVPLQRASNRADIKRAIGEVEAAGGTEMATGLGVGLQELARGMRGRGVSRVLLLTDGRTYGDESRCVELARRAQERGIGITALGVGTEWNEDLLETIAARENSRTQFIMGAGEIAAVFQDELKRLQSIFAQSVKARVELRPGGMLRALDRVRPFIAPVQIIEDKERTWVGSLGDWPGSDTHAFLLELVVPPLPVGEQPLLRASLHYDLPGLGLTGQAVEAVLRVVVKPVADVGLEVDATVKHWLERLVAYRLQASAWKAAEAGKIDEATRRLQMAGTRLFEAGEIKLAQTVHEEATRLLRSGATTDEGRKRIKYGTRGLIGRGDEGGRERGA